MNTSPRWGRTTKQLVSATLLILGGLLLYSFRTLLAPLSIALLGAYILAPVVGWLSRHLHIGRVWVVLLLYLIGIAALTTVPAVYIPMVFTEVEDLTQNLDKIINDAIVWFEGLGPIELWGYIIPLPEITIPTVSLEVDKLMELLEGTISPIAGGAFSVVLTVASGVGWVVFVAVFTFYLLVDAERIIPALHSITPAAYRDEIAKLVARVNHTWNAFLRGQIALSLIIGVMTGAAMGALGIRYAIALGIVAGILEIIPNFGPTLSAVPSVLIALFQGSSVIPLSNLSVAFIVAVTYIIIQAIENNLLVPRIIGASLNLHPLAVIIGVLGGATIGGILGALLAAPLLATLRTVFQYIYRKLADQDPFPEPPSFADLVERQNVRALLFDLDGTLLDTDDMLVDRIAGRLRPPKLLSWLYDSKRIARRMVMAGESPMNAMVTLLDILHLDDKVLSFREWFRVARGQRNPSQYVAIDGVVKLIPELSRRYDLAIITTRNRQDALEFVERFGLQEYFEVIVTRQDVKRLKPHPEPVKKAADELGYPPQQCVVIGDTTVDAKAGKRAGALTVSVLCGFGERAELERLQPTLVLESTAELPKHLPAEDKVWYETW